MMIRRRAHDIDLPTLTMLLSEDAWRSSGPPPQFASRHVIAFFAANPHGSDMLRLGEECAEIQRELRLGRYRDDFHLVSCWAITVDDLVRHLDELDPTIIHFSGHGGPEGVMLHGERGAAEPMAPHVLATLIGETARRARLVVLNACSTAAHASALLDTVDAVVAMDGEIGDDAARMFAARFYGELANRRSIGAAVRLGVAKLEAKQSPDRRLPRCVTRGDIDPRTIFLSSGTVR